MRSSASDARFRLLRAVPPVSGVGVRGRGDPDVGRQPGDGGPPRPGCSREHRGRQEPEHPRHVRVEQPERQREERRADRARGLEDADRPATDPRVRASAITAFAAGSDTMSAAASRTATTTTRTPRGRAVQRWEHDERDGGQPGQECSDRDEDPAVEPATQRVTEVCRQQTGPSRPRTAPGRPLPACASARRTGR